jgi:hypothetical protein
MFLACCFIYFNISITCYDVSNSHEQSVQTEPDTYHVNRNITVILYNSIITRNTEKVMAEYNNSNNE